MKKSTERFREIVSVFASYGFGYMMESSKKVNKKSPANLRKAFEALGPTFIKIGQILSTRSDILPEEYINELIKLQDSVILEEKERLKQVFEESTHKNMDECFRYFNDIPLASASIAQVHEGTLFDGRQVVVKIQRPDILEKMKLDISILKRIFKFLSRRIDIKIINPVEVIEEIEVTTEKELDFIYEGKNILKFKENNKGANVIYAPDLIEEIWSEKVLVLEKISGFKITDINKIKEEGYNQKEIANKLALSYCKQIFDDGFFHADPHPGNILIYNGKICFIDFGIIGELSEELKEWLNVAIISIATKDKNKLVECILAIGIKKGKISKGELYEDISYLVDTYLSTSLKNIKMATMIQELFDITRKNNIQLPRELVILVRGLMIMEGVVAKIDPEIQIIAVIGDYIKSKGILSFLKSTNKEELLISFYQLIRDGARMPSKTIEALDKLNSGKAKMNLVINNTDKVIDRVEGMVNRVTGGLIISSLIISSSLIINSNAGPKYNGFSMLGIVGYIIAIVFAIILLYNMIKPLFNKKNNK
ncbi:MAG: AarF/ABC1/UbiB kinase family protein [Clostridiales bacterium]|nr:AarF/ABC1/UbiB kinase family protein [Clostridiales bacterium]